MGEGRPFSLPMILDPSQLIPSADNWKGSKIMERKNIRTQRKIKGSGDDQTESDGEEGVDTCNQKGQWQLKLLSSSVGVHLHTYEKVNIQDFLQVFQGSGIGKIDDNLTSADPPTTIMIPGRPGKLSQHHLTKHNTCSGTARSTP